MSKSKSTISKTTTPKNALIKHYNQLAKQLDSLKPEQYSGNYAHNYEHAVMAISKQMLTVIGKISLLVE